VQSYIFNKYNIILVSSCRSENFETLEKFYLDLYSNERISKLELKRFSKLETKNYIHMIMPEFVNHSDVIYKESEGNPLFISNIKEDKGKCSLILRYKDI